MSNDIDITNDDEIISYTQKQRKKLADKITEKGMPESLEDRAMFLQTLDGLSKTSIQRKRIGVDEAANETTKIAASAISNVLSHFGETNPFLRDGAGAPKAVDRARLPDPAEVPGEVDIGLVNNNYENFQAVHKANKEKQA
jgi:hypothetical protein